MWSGEMNESEYEAGSNLYFILPMRFGTWAFIRAKTMQMEKTHLNANEDEIKSNSQPIRELEQLKWKDVLQSHDTPWHGLV